MYNQQTSSSRIDLRIPFKQETRPTTQPHRKLGRRAVTVLSATTDSPNSFKAEHQTPSLDALNKLAPYGLIAAVLH